MPKNGLESVSSRRLTELDGSEFEKLLGVVGAYCG